MQGENLPSGTVSPQRARRVLVRGAAQMTQPLHPMDKWPPDATGEWRMDDSVDVTLHFADGTTATGYHSGWSGWMSLGVTGIPLECAHDDPAMWPIGWSALEAP